MRGDKATPVLVTLGITDGTVTEIVGGEVKEGDDIVIEAIDPGAASGPGSGPPRGRMF